ncbi:hypothetical protein GCM10020220_028730 [Nonomuraea rubra]
MKGLLVSGFAAIAAGSGAMLSLHAGSDLDPFHSVISEYVWQSAGWLLPASLTLFAAGAALIAEAMRRAGLSRWIVALLLVWGASMFLIGPSPPTGRACRCRCRAASTATPLSPPSW